MTIEVTAFDWVPPTSQGYVKDLRVRWALEEAGLPFQVTLVDGQILASDDYRRRQPFGQVPAYKDDVVELFESGAIVLYLASRSETLAPRDDAGRARVMSWVIAALNSVEPHVQNVVQRGRAYDAWTAEHQPQLEVTMNAKLTALTRWLDGKDYLEGRFTAGDLIMTTVIRELVECGALARYPILDAYRRRCEARPAFGRALEAQLQPFRDRAPA
jgi:glutathione S-transferase